MLALRCLLAAQAIDSEDARLKEHAVRFEETVRPILGSMDPKVQEVVGSLGMGISAADIGSLQSI